MKGRFINMPKTKKPPKIQPVPQFETEDAERAFWATHDSADYVDWSQAVPASMPELKPTMRTISIRLPETMIARLKTLANKRDVPYQSLLKMYVADRISAELKTHT